MTNVIFEHIGEMKYVVKQIREEIKNDENTKRILTAWDNAPYGQGCLRMLYCNKTDKKNTLLPFTHDARHWERMDVFNEYYSGYENFKILNSVRYSKNII